MTQAMNDPGSTGARKWVKQQPVRRWGAMDWRQVFKKATMMQLLEARLQVKSARNKQEQQQLGGNRAPRPSGAVALALCLAHSFQAHHPSNACGSHTKRHSQTILSVTCTHTWRFSWGNMMLRWHACAHVRVCVCVCAHNFHVLYS